MNMKYYQFKAIITAEQTAVPLDTVFAYTKDIKKPRITAIQIIEPECGDVIDTVNVGTQSEEQLYRHIESVLTAYEEKRMERFNPPFGNIGYPDPVAQMMTNTQYAQYQQQQPQYAQPMTSPFQPQSQPVALQSMAYPVQNPNPLPDSIGAMISFDREDELDQVDYSIDTHPPRPGEVIDPDLQGEDTHDPLGHAAQHQHIRQETDDKDNGAE